MKKLILSLLLIIFPTIALAEPIRVVLLNPGGNHWFWNMMIDYMQAAAEDLDMQLEVISSDRDHYLTVQQAKEVVSRKIPPDYIITGNEKSNAGQVIRVADEAGVKVFLFNNGFVNVNDIEAYGQPREKYKHWIGEMIPNNFSAGYQIGETLINRALESHSTDQEGKIPIAAIAGAFATHASSERVRGLRAVVGEFADQVELLQVIPSNWTYERAEKIGKALFERYKNVRIIWGANDTTAMGAMSAANSLGKKPGEDVFFGGCGWYGPALEMIHKGTLTTSVGGHFMEGGWAMVLLHDYHHGKDFISDPIETKMYSIDKRNIEKYSKTFVKQQWQNIDFKKFSKVHNPNLKKYDFSLEAVLQQF